jgi:hypothetical protein
MAITIREKYLRLLEKMKDPIFYAEFSKKRLERQRRYYATHPDIVAKRNLSTADWKFRKARDLPIRPRIQRKPEGLVIAKAPVTPMAPIQPMVFSCSFD